MDANELLNLYRLGERDFRHSNLQGQSFKGQDLSGVDLSESYLHRTDFSESNLCGANLTGVKFSSANYKDIRIGKDIHSDIPHYFWANLSSANLKNAVLKGVDLRGVNLSGADLGGADLSEVNLCDVSWGKSASNLFDLISSQLQDDELRSLSSPMFDIASLENTRARPPRSLHGTIFFKASLKGAVLCELDLMYADFREADLTGANFSKASLTSANLRHCLVKAWWPQNLWKIGFQKLSVAGQ